MFNKHCPSYVNRIHGAGIAQSVYRLATGWTVRGSNPGGGEIFRTLPVVTVPGAHTASYTMGTGSFQGDKRPGRGLDHPPPSSAEVEGRVELYIFSPSASLWPVIGKTLPLPYLYVNRIYLTPLPYVFL